MQRKKTLQQLVPTSLWNSTSRVAGTATPTKELPITEDTTDELGNRQVTIQTTVTGNNKDGYKAAERQAHEWFFVNYDQNVKRYKKLIDQGKLTEMCLGSGHLDPAWLEASHPTIELDEGTFMFGHHTGLNPSSPEGTWGFWFEIMPMMSLN
jgi:hypothetical protein